MKRVLFIALMACAFVSGDAFAAKAKADKAAKPKKEKKAPVMEEITLTGTVSVIEKKVKDKEIKTYVLTDENGGKTTLPKSKDKDLAEYVDAQVKITGQGMTKGKGDKAKKMLKKIDSVEKIDAGGNQ